MDGGSANQHRAENVAVVLPSPSRHDTTTTTTTTCARLDRGIPTGASNVLLKKTHTKQKGRQRSEDAGGKKRRQENQNDHHLQRDVVSHAE